MFAETRGINRASSSPKIGGGDTSQNASGTPYWILALPWGAEWGEGGFARVRRGEAAVEAAPILVEPMV